MRIELEFVVSHVTQSSALEDQGVRMKLAPSQANVTGNTTFSYCGGELWLQILDRTELAKWGSGKAVQVNFEV